jgi:hypothetical protein
MRILGHYRMRITSLKPHLTQALGFPGGLMNFKISNRQFLSAAIIVFYLIPLLFFSAYSIKLMSHNKSWTLLSLGLLLVVFGTLSLIFLLFYWEQSMRGDKKSTNSLLSQTPPTLFLTEKEAKVTSLDSSLTFSPLAHHDELDHMSSKETTKELNLLQTALKINQERQEELVQALEIKGQELHKQEEENKQLQLKVQQIAQDFADYKLFSEEQLKQKQMQLITLQQVIEDQRSEMEKRQEQIHQLDTKVHDLSYEIKTLLYLHEEEASPAQSALIKEEMSLSYLNETPKISKEQANIIVGEASIEQENNIPEKAIQAPIEAALLLKKCINIAQKLAGANYYSNESSRYREFSSSYFAIDQRRLFDSLRGETGALLVVYSQKEQKLLFANNESKTILGWNPEKFLADFAAIMQEGIQDWKKALHILSTTSESQARLLAKTKQGQEMLLNCHLGVIPSGLFRNYVIGVLYPA